ncbi:MAG TPA: TetR family transcriptional regulator [Sphingobacteriaceae bacterium]
MIKDTALEMFNARGIENVGVREIGRQLDMSPGNISYYYPTKNDLVADIYHDFVETTGGYFATSTDDVVLQPDDLITLIKRSMTSQHHYRCLFQGFNVLIGLPELAEAVSRHDLIWRQRIASLFQAWRKAGLVRSHVTEQEEVLLFSLLKFIMVYRFIDAGIHHAGKTGEETDSFYLQQVISLLALFVIRGKGNL